MNTEDRLNRALTASAAPAKDMHFTLQVMRAAEAARFRAETARRLLRGAALASLAAVAILPVAGWLAENMNVALDVGLAAGGALAALSFIRGLRIGTPAR